MNFSEALTTTWKFFSEGGIFMLFLALCSLVAITVIIMKFLSLKREQILPPHLESEVENFEEHLEKDTLGELQTEFERGENALARLCTVAISNAGRTQGEVQEAVQSSAREEIVRMNSGMPVLDVIITIAPLLGLLGTTSGLMTVFGDLDDKDTISRGIAVALSTTIVGLAIAVPAVIAQSYFTRRIETMAARLEVLLGKVVSACHQHVFFRDK
ncbi:MotA/TolQ/ExbB proton channel family protein [bacterium]|nr:MotA/TolQ/ExbB proton channel family protein [bacterium]MDB4734185.1 MotA/TolQ/ExbB proton channel family protein [Akkermansiaceae bacterium]MDB4666782.1 MotA/TolQ/ExbB proton channel family protein [bacterium]MDB4745436.1 MotA/TolQ/ExbB proton channel family protein [bacterium]MDB4753898.1 MotA/TolQ/ExbB proton channel family protein [Akkermansiaceae bacterium]